MARSFPIKYDSTAIFLVLLASSELVFAALFPDPVRGVSVFVVVMMLVGLVDERLANKGQIAEVSVGGMRTKNVLAYTAGAVSVFFALNAFAPAIPTFAKQVLQNLPLATVGLQTAIVFSQEFLLLVAVAEESFFRGLWANVFISKLGLTVGAGMDALFFVGYHIVSYGDALFLVVNGNSYPSPVSLVLFGAGYTLAYVDFRTGTVATSMIGHIVNNSFAGGLIPLPAAVYLPFVGGSAFSIVGTVGFTLAIAAVQLTMRRRGIHPLAYVVGMLQGGLRFV